MSVEIIKIKLIQESEINWNSKTKQIDLFYDSFHKIYVMIHFIKSIY